MESEALRYPVIRLHHRVTVKDYVHPRCEVTMSHTRTGLKTMKLALLALALTDLLLFYGIARSRRVRLEGLEASAKIVSVYPVENIYSYQHIRDVAKTPF